MRHFLLPGDFHAFGASDREWGYRQFMPLTQLLDPEQGFLDESGALIITCKLEVSFSISSFPCSNTVPPASAARGVLDPG